MRYILTKDPAQDIVSLRDQKGVRRPHSPRCSTRTAPSGFPTPSYGLPGRPPGPVGGWSFRRCHLQRGTEEGNFVRVTICFTY